MIKLTVVTLLVTMNVLKITNMDYILTIFVALMLFSKDFWIGFIQGLFSNRK